MHKGPLKCSWCFRHKSAWHLQARVSLYSLNDGSYVRRKIFHASNRLFKVRGIGSDGELPLLCIGGRIVSEFRNGCVVETRVQSAPELIQHLSEFERKWENPVPFDWLKKESPSPIAIHLWARGISLVSVKRFQRFTRDWQ